MRPTQQSPGYSSLAKRALWFVGLWLAGVAVVALAGLLIRALLATV